MQMAFEDIEIQQKQAKVRELASELDRRLKEVAHGIERKHLATLNDKSYSYISEILNTNGDQKPFQVSLIPSLIIENPDAFKRVIIDFLCELIGHKAPEKKKELCPEEELAIIKQKIEEHGLAKIFDL